MQTCSSLSDLVVAVRGNDPVALEALPGAEVQDQGGESYDTG